MMSPDDIRNIIAIAHRIGIGTSEVPHGGVGRAKFAIEGIDNNLPEGPNIQFTTNADDYPLLSILNDAHDDIYIAFDAYFDTPWRSSDAGSNFLIQKSSDELRFLAEGGVAVGNAITWSSGIVIDNVGNVAVGTYAPATDLHLYENSADTEPTFRVEQDGAGDAAQMFLLTGGQSWSLGIDNSDADKFKISSGADVNTNTRLTIDIAGNVGIGETAPGHPLQVNCVGSIAAQFGNGTGNTVVEIDRAAGGLGDIRFQTAGSHRWFVRCTADAETGGDAGSNFTVNRRSDAGADLGFPFFIRRSTGNFGINCTAANVSALLELQSTTGALLVPRMNAAQRIALTALAGMIIFNTTTVQFEGCTVGGGAPTWVGL